MFLSRVTLDLAKLKPSMLQKWMSESQPYASHQWLWQLFPGEEKRNFLFRQEPTAAYGLFYLLSETRPLQEHFFFTVETKPFLPKLYQGMCLLYSLCANPVITRQRKRSDILMDAKFQAKKQGIASSEWRGLQEQAAQTWLEEQGRTRGFELLTENKSASHIIAYQQKKVIARKGSRPISYSTVNYSGYLKVTEPELFIHTLGKGVGKSKGLGCGLFLIRRG